MRAAIVSLDFRRFLASGNMANYRAKIYNTGLLASTAAR